jgi:hypothetical protein
MSASHWHETDSGTHRLRSGRYGIASTTTEVTFRVPPASPFQLPCRACTTGLSVARGNGDCHSHGLELFQRAGLQRPPTQRFGEALIVGKFSKAKYGKPFLSHLLECI